MKCQAHARMSRARASHQTKAKFERMFCPKAAPTTVPEREALIRKLSPEGCMTLARETFGREPSSSDVAFVKSAVRDLFCLVFFSLLCILILCLCIIAQELVTNQVTACQV